MYHFFLCELEEEICANYSFSFTSMLSRASSLVSVVNKKHIHKNIHIKRSVEQLNIVRLFSFFSSTFLVVAAIFFFSLSADKLVRFDDNGPVL